MAHDVVVRFDELDHVSSRLGQTAMGLSFSPTDHPAPAHSATNGFPEVFNASLADLAADKNSFVDDIESVASGVQATSSMFSDTDSTVADGAAAFMRGA